VGYPGASLLFFRLSKMSFAESFALGSEGPAAAREKARTKVTKGALYLMPFWEEPCLR
jgi:hypothetical protein